MEIGAGVFNKYTHCKIDLSHTTRSNLSKYILNQLIIYGLSGVLPIVGNVHSLKY